MTLRDSARAALIMLLFSNRPQENKVKSKSSFHSRQGNQGDHPVKTYLLLGVLMKFYVKNVANQMKEIERCCSVYSARPGCSKAG